MAYFIHLTSIISRALMLWISQVCYWYYLLFISFYL